MTKKPAELRKNHYPPLSALTKRVLGYPPPTIDEELASVREIIDYYERNDWQGLSQEDYDTLYPELTSYLADLNAK